MVTGQRHGTGMKSCGEWARRAEQFTDDCKCSFDPTPLPPYLAASDIHEFVERWYVNDIAFDYERLRLGATRLTDGKRRNQQIELANSTVRHEAVSASVGYAIS